MGRSFSEVVFTTLLLIFTVVETSFQQKSSNVEKGYPYNGNEKGLKPRISNGQKAERGEFPFMVFLTASFDKVDMDCGGALISEQYILSAAHCFMDGSEKATLVQVELGVYNKHQELDEKYLQTVTKKNIHMHEDFNLTYRSPDVAILKLPTPVKMEPGLVEAACLSKLKNIPIGTMLTVAGWGDHSYSDEGNGDLYKVDLPIAPNCKCNFNSFNPDIQLCVGFGNTSATCKGDSGGPLFVPNQTPSPIVGVVHGGMLCNNTEQYKSFAKIEVFLDWIEAITGPVSC